ncbi:MAG TPA: DUF5666 domain-containing protein [Candidatus Paceibacterota bacterium]|nr:DUF5666 domain-containing protein [Candidatus Paceibacterota bacterium]
MKRTILKIAVCALFAAPVFSRGQDSNTMAAPAATEPLPVAAAPAAEIPAANAPAPAKAKKPRTSFVASGKVSSVDTNAMTLTVGKRTFEITSETRISKGGNPAILSDIAVDDKVGIAFKKAEGKLDAVTIKDSVKPKKSDGKTKDDSDQK